MQLLGSQQRHNLSLLRRRGKSSSCKWSKRNGDSDGDGHEHISSSDHDAEEDDGGDGDDDHYAGL